jgi:endogenous inhibitor of DNA gyrase (YacG/DUF329 family)
MPEPDPKDVSIVPAAPCPICGKLSIHDYRPFCSKRCADVDLHRWLKGVYVIPGKVDEDEDGEGAGDQAAPGPKEE